MQTCPICEKTYSDEVGVCPVDGARLQRSGVKPDPLIGQTLKGRFRILNKLGEGGMGTVYLAEQLSIGRKVALKVLQADFARDAEFVRRFRDEARAAASVKHRNVTIIHDYDQAEDGSLFIAMECLEGRSLAEIIRQEGAMGVERVVRLGVQIAEGLEAAHRAGVIHRDVKPQNIMLVGPGDEVKLLDFGIARLQEPDTPALTRAGIRLGTPEYMAPEQIEGGAITERTDIYAFGIVLYQMLTGAGPFTAPTTQALLMKQLYEAPVPLRGIRAEIPSALEQLVMQALEKKSERRQRDMGEVAEGLRLVEDILTDKTFPRTLVSGGETLAVGPETIPVRAETPEPPPAAARAHISGIGRWVAGHRVAVAGLGVLVLVLIGSVALVVRSWGPDALRKAETMQKPSAVASPQPVSSKDLDEAARREVEAARQAEADRQRELEEADWRRQQEATARRRAEAKLQQQELDVRRQQQETPRQRAEAKALEQAVQAPPKVAMVFEDPNRLRKLVEERLRGGGFLKGSSSSEFGVTVEVSSDRIVTLIGILRTRQERTETVRLAREISGVTEVRQRINVLESWQEPSN